MQDQQTDTETEEEGPEKEKPSFWKTLPGILTGFAAVVTALAALLTAVDKTGFLSSNSSGARIVPQDSETEGGIKTTGDNSPVVNNTGGDVNITSDQ